ncbi:TetR/AcrR family transcriptional regulator [Achromobacter xylosoxidans]
MSRSTPRKEQTHERIVEVAARAVRREGYAGVGVADIMKEAGLTHGGFYAHFPSRDAMLVEAVERAGQDGAARLMQRMEQWREQGASRCARWSRPICRKRIWAAARAAARCRRWCPKCRASRRSCASPARAGCAG